MNRNAKAIQGKSKEHTVTPLPGGYTFRVTSGASGNEYTVRVNADLSGAGCTCDWARYRPAKGGRVCGCSHVVAVFRFLSAEANGARVSVWASEADARRQHHSYFPIGDGLWVTTRTS